MHDKAFTFQTLHPDTIIDGLFDLGMRVDSGLTPLNSYENRVYQFQDEDRHRYVVKFYRPERWSAEQILEEHQFAFSLCRMKSRCCAAVFNDSTLHQHQGFFLPFSQALVAVSLKRITSIRWSGLAAIWGACTRPGANSVLSRARRLAQEYLLEPRQVFEHSTLIPSGLKPISCGDR
jgi:hypothetical protein